MIKTLPWFILLLLPGLAFGQNFMVTQSKAAYYLDGSPVSSGLPIDSSQHVVIKKKGLLLITYKKRWSFILEPGTHSLDSAIRAQMTSPSFVKHDSIYTVLEQKGLIDCSFKYKYREKLQGVVDGVEIVDNLKVENSFLNTPYDTLTIRWKNPVAYTGNYYVVIYNMFEDMIDLHVTEADHLQLTMMKYKKDKTILYKIIAEDCRASDNNAIKKGYKD